MEQAPFFSGVIAMGFAVVTFLPALLEAYARRVVSGLFSRLFSASA